MVSETKRNLVITGLQRASEYFGELACTILNCAPKNFVLDGLIWTQMILKEFFNKRHF